MASFRHHNHKGIRHHWTRTWFGSGDPSIPSTTLHQTRRNDATNGKSDIDDEWAVLSLQPESDFDVQSLPETHTTGHTANDGVHHIAKSCSMVDLRSPANTNSNLGNTVTRMQGHTPEVHDIRRPESPEYPEYHDFRSARKARRRDKKEMEKYYGYRFVHRGQLGQPHLPPVDHFDRRQDPLDRPPEKAVTMTKQMLYADAQKYPRPPRFHHGRSSCSDFRSEPKHGITQGKKNTRALNFHMDPA